MSFGQRVRAFVGVERGELAFALLMFGQFFLTITTFWILKPLKKTLFISFYDERGFALLGTQLSAAQAELIAKVLNMGVAALAVVAFTLLARRLRREQIAIACAGFFIVSLGLFWPLVGDPAAPTVWSFYLFGDLFSTLMVAAFFAFLNDSVTSGGAKRLYGLIGLGGVAGGAFGSLALATAIDAISIPTWLVIAAGLVGVIAGLAWAAGRERPAAEETAPEDEPEPEVPSNAALEGARLVWRSPYLLAVVAIVGLYEIVSTVMDFQFSATVAHYLDGEKAIGQQFSTIYALSNAVAFAVQLFLTGPIMRRFGVGVALLVLPATTLLGSAAFLALPILWVGSLLNTADSGFAYSINQSAKEALYVPTSRDEKYKAKAFIDMFVQRFAKALAVGVSLAMGAFFGDFESVRWLSIFTIAVIAAQAYAAHYAGRRFREREREGAAEPADALRA